MTVEGCPPAVSRERSGIDSSDTPGFRWAGWIVCMSEYRVQRVQDLHLVRISHGLVSRALEHGERRVFRKTRVAEGQTAEDELGPARAADDLHVCASDAQACSAVNDLPGPVRIVHHA